MQTDRPRDLRVTQAEHEEVIQGLVAQERTLYNLDAKDRARRVAALRERLASIQELLDR